MKTKLEPEDFIDDAAKLGCEVAAIRAVAEVESAGGGFDPEGFPKTLFEGHIFHRLTGGKFSVSHPSLSYAKWTKKFYGDWKKEKARLQEAMTLDRAAAIQSASWGAFQIMGMNHALAGFSKPQQFVNAMCKDANSQLEVFTQFIIQSGLDDELRDRRWRDFARRYNGPQYALNQYDVKIAAAYSRLTKI